MTMLTQIVPAIHPISDTHAARARQHLDNLTKPPGSLGLLEDVATQLVAITGSSSPGVARKVVFTLAADHGVARSGVSAYPSAVTAQMVHNFLAGGAAVNVLARQAGARMIVADFGVAEDLSSAPGLVHYKINYGTRNFSEEPAMSAEEAVRALESGIALFETEYARGIDLVATGEMGIGNTTSASAIVATVSGRPACEVTGRGTGIDDAVLARKIDLIDAALLRHRPNPEDGLDILCKVGGFEIAGMAGIMLAAAARRVPVVVDGFISGAAALVASRFSPFLTPYLIAGHCSVEAGHRTILDSLGLVPLLDLRLRLGEGTGAVLAMNLVESACCIYNQMATFERAGVAGKA